MEFNSQFESFYSCIHSEQECQELIHAARQGYIGRIRRRLNENEKSKIKYGSIFIYNEEESGIRRWTDKREWSPSRVQGIFLVYKDLNGPLIKKTYGCNLKDGRYHIVAYSLVEWESTAGCCRYFNKSNYNHNFFKSGKYYKENIIEEKYQNKICNFGEKKKNDQFFNFSNQNIISMGRGVFTEGLNSNPFSIRNSRDNSNNQDSLAEMTFIDDNKDHQKALSVDPLLNEIMLGRNNIHKHMNFAPNFDSWEINAHLKE